MMLKQLRATVVTLRWTDKGFQGRKIEATLGDPHWTISLFIISPKLIGGTEHTGALM